MSDNDNFRNFHDTPSDQIKAGDKIMFCGQLIEVLSVARGRVNPAIKLAVDNDRATQLPAQEEMEGE